MKGVRDRAGAGEEAFAPSLRLAPSRRWAAGFAAIACNMALFGAFAAHFAGVGRVAAREEGSSLKLFVPAVPVREAAPEPLARAERRPVADGAATDRIDPVPPAATLKVAAGAAPPPVAAPMVAPPAPTVAPPPPVAPAVVEAGSERDAAWAEYQRQVRARIAVRRPAGLHMTGVATLRFTLDAAGRLATLDLAQGSGNAMLDRLALRTVRSASPFPPPPDGVARERLAFTIGFSFH